MKRIPSYLDEDIETETNPLEKEQNSFKKKDFIGFFRSKILMILIFIIVLGVLIFFLFKIFPSMNLHPSNRDIKLLMKAAQNNDISYCKKIEDHNIYYDCYDKIWLQEDNCKFQQTVGKNLDECYMNLALKKQNFELCNFIEEYEMQTSCFTQLFTSISIDLCADYLPCLTYWFETTNSSDICKKITDVSKHDDCFENYAFRFFDSQRCGDIQNKTKREECFFELLPPRESKKYISNEHFFELVDATLIPNGYNFALEDCAILNFTNDQIDSVITQQHFELFNLRKNDKQYLFIDGCYLIVSIKQMTKNSCNYIHSDGLNTLCVSYFDKNCENLINNQALYNFCESVKYENDSMIYFEKFNGLLSTYINQT